MSEKYLFEAKTALGIGHPQFFREEFNFINTPTSEELMNAKRKFAIKFGVELDHIQIKKIN